MIDEILNFLLGLVDGTSDNDDDANEKLKEMEKCKLRYELRKIRRK